MNRGLCQYDLHTNSTLEAMAKRIHQIVQKHENELTGDNYAKLIWAFTSLQPAAHPYALQHIQSWCKHIQTRASTILKPLDAVTILHTLLTHIASGRLKREHVLSNELQQILLTIAQQSPLPTPEANVMLRDCLTILNKL
jgi:hypothetical protein